MAVYDGKRRFADLDKAELDVTPAQQSLSDSYLWEVPGKKVSVRLDFGAVDRLLIEVMRGFGAIPKRGAEVGGLLLGRVERTEDGAVAHVEDFEPVACEHRRGPSYLLSEADMAGFADAVSRFGGRVVGIYRSHTREGMGLAAEDLSLLDQHAPDAASVFLLVKPYATRVSTAGFFFREPDGAVRAESSYQEFPFRRKELGGGATPAVERGRERNRPAAAAAETTRMFETAEPEYAEAAGFGATTEQLQAALAKIPLPAPGPIADSGVARFRRTNVWIPLSFIFLLLGVLVGFQAALNYKPSRAANALNEAYTLSLTVARSGENLHVRWDRNSIAVRAAQRGVLNITDGTYGTTVDLDVAQLQNPSVFYRNMSPSVRFRLEVFTKERNSVSEILDWTK